MILSDSTDHMSEKLLVKNITRINSLGEKEMIEFTSGVNLLVGASNSGKTVWLMMLDYLLGDAGSVEDALNKDDRDGQFLYEIFDELSVVIEINNVDYLIERKWKQKGLKSKILVDNQAYDASEFSKFILEKLSIPVIKFPKGNPYQDGAWIELTFRILFRHIYRQERFWGDLADKQPESEQHAAICQFLGLAEYLFSPLGNELIDKRKELIRLQAQKDQFQEVLDQITKRLLPAGEKSITFVTVDSLNERIRELRDQSQVLLAQRQSVIANGINASLDEAKPDVALEIKLTEDRARIVQDLETSAELRKREAEKLNRFANLLKSVDSEYSKLNRAKSAGELLADIKITHCPACDQEIDPKPVDEDTCFLCHQPLNHSANEDRVEFELHQLDSERKELRELIERIKGEQEESMHKHTLLYDSLITIDQQLAPLKQRLSGLVQAQVSAFDLRRGKLEEQIQNFNRVLKTLNYRDELSKKIDDLNALIQRQINDLPKNTETIEYEQGADDLCDGMMEYINKIAATRPDRWPFTEGNNRIRLYLNDKRFNFRVGRTNWYSIGAKPKTYFLLAYHYGLLKLSLQNTYNYPGLLIIDFPPVLADGDVKSSENYLIKPFIELCESANNTVQVIIAGEAFEELENVNTITLEGAYK